MIIFCEVLHFVAHPAADSMIEPFSSQFSWQSHTTTGAISSGFNSAKKSKIQFYIQSLKSLQLGCKTG